MEYPRLEREFAGRQLSYETGRLANQASGAVLARYNDVMVLCCATMSEKPREGIDFMPLTVDFEEKMYAAGKVPGGFFRREGRAGEKAILSARLIDRPLRPLFAKGLRHDVHLVLTVMSVDGENYSDVLALNGISTALQLSNIPLAQAVGAVRIGKVDGELIVNPTYEQVEEGTLELTVAGTREAVTMIEANAHEVSEEEVLEAIELAHNKIKEIIDQQEEFVRMATEGREIEKLVVEQVEPDAKKVKEVRSKIWKDLEGVYGTPGKQERSDKYRAIEESLLEDLDPKDPEQADEIKLRKSIYQSLLEEQLRQKVLKEGTRVDGRAMDELRPIWVDTSVIPRAHGSAIFTRGETQALTTVTLGSKKDDQKIDDLTPDEFKRYLHHYNFPPYSVGEARFMRGPGRREIGHGALAEKAVAHMVPPAEEFPYTVRLVSEILASNGSSSMASVCGSSLALMDAGVPIKAPVAGIAMGLISDYDKPGNVAILTDIQGIEDHYGDMDYKVAGTREGITAIQLDIKISGLTIEIMRGALEQARTARMQILDIMEEHMPEARAELSNYAPRVFHTMIKPEKIGELIGPGGKNIRAITDEFDVQIDIEDDGSVFIFSVDADAARAALAKVEEHNIEAEVGKTYTGKVVRIVDFGAFIEILPGKDGLMHISCMAPHRIDNVRDVFSEGDEVEVVVAEIDELTGRIRLFRAGHDGSGRKLEDGAQPDFSQRGPGGSGGGGRDRDRGPRDRDRGGRDRGPRDRDRGGRDRGPRDRDRRPDSRSRDDRPRDDRSRNERPRDERPRDDRPRDDRPRDDRRDDRRRDDRSRDDRRRDDRPRDERPRDDRPRDERPRDERPRDERPRDERPRDERPRDERPRDDRKREERPERSEQPQDGGEERAPRRRFRR